jgi:hypothetical protein
VEERVSRALLMQETKSAISGTERYNPKERKETQSSTTVLLWSLRSLRLASLGS